MQNQQKEFSGHNSRKVGYTVESEAAGQRLDAWLAGQLGDQASRTVIQRWIEAGHVSTPTGVVGQGRRVQPGETYTVEAPEPVSTELVPVDLKLKVVHEDADCAIIHKPAGIAVHPGPGDTRITIAHGILYQWGSGVAGGEAGANDNPDAGDRLRPGIVHRLDRDTEGLLLIAKHDRARRKLMERFARREVRKDYLACLGGNLPRARGRIELALRRDPRNRLKMRVDPAGRMAITEFEIERAWSGRHGRKYYRVHVELLTGRTHQIRVHMAHLGAPVVGDLLYSRPTEEFREFGMLLLARRLAFQQPFTGESIDLTLEVPDRFQEFEARSRIE